MTTKQNYDAEIKNNEAREYAYGFDFDVMHGFMVRSFKPFFRDGPMLEFDAILGASYLPIRFITTAGLSPPASMSSAQFPLSLHGCLASCRLTAGHRS